MSIKGYYSKEGRMDIHDYGKLYDSHTNEFLGYALRCLTREYPDSFSMNIKDFKRASRPGSTCKFAIFESIPGNKKIVLTMTKAMKLLEAEARTQPSSEYVVISWNEIVGVKDPLEIPVEESEQVLPFERKLPF